MEFTPEMINKLNIVEKNILIELYNKSKENRFEDHISVPARKEWTIPGPGLNNPKVSLNPLVTAGIVTKAGYSTVALTSLVGRE